MFDNFLLKYTADFSKSTIESRLHLQSLIISHRIHKRTLDAVEDDYTEEQQNAHKGERIA